VEYGEHGRHPLRKFRQKVRRLWKQYAREALDLTAHLGPRKLVVRYNDWFQSEAYRKDLAERLGLEFSDAGLEDVTKFGFGSSFDRQAFHGRAQQMDVMARWRKYENEASYRSLFDEEMCDLSRKLFGVVAGTERLASGPSDRDVRLRSRPPEATS